MSSENWPCGTPLSSKAPATSVCDDIGGDGADGGTPGASSTYTVTAVITNSGTVDLIVTPPITITNIVTVTSPLEIAPSDNVASVKLAIMPEIEQPPRVWLPWVAR